MDLFALFVVCVFLAIIAVLLVGIRERLGDVWEQLYEMNGAFDEFDVEEDAGHE